MKVPLIYAGKPLETLRSSLVASSARLVGLFERKARALSLFSCSPFHHSPTCNLLEQTVAPVNLCNDLGTGHIRTFRSCSLRLQRFLLRSPWSRKHEIEVSQPGRASGAYGRPGTR